MRNLPWWVTTLLCVGGCNANVDTPRTALGSGGSGKLGSGGVNPATVGGSPSATSSGGARSGTTGGAASGGLPASAGGSNSAMGGRTTSGGTSATGGQTNSGGSTSSGGALSGDLAIASGLNHRVEVPCTGPGEEPDLCESSSSLPDTVVTLNGDPQKMYKIAIHIRGLTEGHTFNDLNGQPVGTITTAPYFLDSSQGVPLLDDHGLFWIEVTAPAKSYYLNAFYSVDGPLDHVVYPLDYMAELTVAGGTTATIKFADVNSTQQVNNMNNVVIPGIPPAPAAFDGSFLQIDVVSVTQL